jgi:hypothetical protein
MKEIFNKYFATAWLILAFISVSFWLILENNFSLENLISYSEYVCLLYLIYNSRSLKSKNAIIYLVGNFILIIGILFKIMHWPYNNELLLVSPILIFAGYLLFFYKHTNQNWLDILKLSWIGISSMSIIWFTLKLPNPYLIEHLNSFLFWPIYIGVAWFEAKGNDQSIEINSELENNMPEDIL